VTQSQGFDSHNDCEINESMLLLCKPPWVKNHDVFFAQKSLEQVVDVLKERISPTPAIEPSQGFIDKPTVKKIRKKKKQGNSVSSFTNKRIKQPNNMIIKKLNKFHHHKFRFVKLLK
jgi:hypothetical protein